MPVFANHSLYQQQQPTTGIYNLAWHDAHAHTTQELHLARAMQDPRRVRRAPSQPTGSYNMSVNFNGQNLKQEFSFESGGSTYIQG